MWITIFHFSVLAWSKLHGFGIGILLGLWPREIPAPKTPHEIVWFHQTIIVVLLYYWYFCSIITILVSYLTSAPHCSPPPGGPSWWPLTSKKYVIDTARLITGHKLLIFINIIIRSHNVLIIMVTHICIISPTDNDWYGLSNVNATDVMIFWC